MRLVCQKQHNSRSSLRILLIFWAMAENNIIRKVTNLDYEINSFFLERGRKSHFVFNQIFFSLFPKGLKEIFPICIFKKNSVLLITLQIRKFMFLLIINLNTLNYETLLFFVVFQQVLHIKAKL